MKNTRAYLLLNLAVIMFGFAGLFGKWLNIPAIGITFGRVFFAFISLFVVQAFSRNKFTLAAKHDYVFSALSGILLAFHWFAFFKSVQLATVGIALFSYSTFPLFTALLEPVFFREKFKTITLLLAFIALLGVGLMIPVFDFTNLITIGIVWGVLSGLSFSLIAIINRGLVRRNPAALLSFYFEGFACLSLLPALFFIPFTINIEDLILLVLLGTVFTALAHSLFIESMRHIKAAYASLTASLESVYGLIFAILLIHEIPSIKTLLGGAFILTAVVIASVQNQ